jgi:hypothetical protein
MQRQMPEDDFQLKLAKAEDGDLSAEKDVWGYYVACGEKARARYWEDRLFRAGDADALAARSDDIFMEAYDLRDNDPRKLSLLRRAVEVEARARKAHDGRTLHVIINGKEQEIHESGEPDEGTRTMQTLLARVEAAQQKAVTR